MRHVPSFENLDQVGRFLANLPFNRPFPISALPDHKREWFIAAVRGWMEARFGRISYWRLEITRDDKFVKRMPDE